MSGVFESATAATAGPEVPDGIQGAAALATPAVPTPNHKPLYPLWTRHALLVAPYAEFLVLLMFLSDNNEDRIRLAVFLAFLLPFSMFVVRPVVEPMLPEDPRVSSSEHIPARLIEWGPGSRYTKEYETSVRKPFNFAATSYTVREEGAGTRHPSGKGFVAVYE